MHRQHARRISDGSSSHHQAVTISLPERVELGIRQASLEIHGAILMVACVRRKQNFSLDNQLVRGRTLIGAMPCRRADERDENTAHRSFVSCELHSIIRCVSTVRETTLTLA